MRRTYPLTFERSFVSVTGLPNSTGLHTSIQNLPSHPPFFTRIASIDHHHLPLSLSVKSTRKMRAVSRSLRLPLSHSRAFLSSTASLSTTDHRRQHISAIGLAVLTPVAALLPSSTPVALPVDLALSLLVPLHMATGMKQVVTDYAPQNVQAPSNMLVYGIAGLTAAGLINLSLTDGLAASVKAIWN